ncbi:MAG: AAA family ATPase [Methylomonas sp.]|nr:AAA family ATPase [Methylomonas sp.]
MGDTLDSVRSEKPPMGMSISNQKTVLSCYFLGEPYVLCQGRRIEALAEGKMLGLLAYLVMGRERKHRREFLAELLWPDLPSDQARAYLRHLLHRLQQALKQSSETSPLQVTRDWIGIDGNASIWLDGDAFAENLNALDQELQYLAIQEAKLALYRGPMLDGLAISASDTFQEWLVAARERFHQQALRYHDKLASDWLARGHSRKALDLAKRRADLDAADEHGQRQLMRHLAASGDFAAVDATYRRLVSVLRQELGLAPSQETVELHAQLLSREKTSLQAPGADQLMEIRQITVICCAFSASSPPLDERLPYLRNDQIRAEAIIKSLSGHALKGWHGRVFGYFAYPQASENAALSAAKAAVRIRDHFETEVVKIGIHTGLLLCDGDMDDPDPEGQVSALAMRLESLAGPGDILLSETAAALLSRHIDSEQVSTDFAPAVQRLVRIRPSELGLHATFFKSRFRGRRQALSHLFAAWRNARRRNGSVLRLEGEPGIGKSRLIHEFSRRLYANAAVSLIFRGIAEQASTPLAPIKNWFAAWVDADSETEHSPFFADDAAYAEMARLRGLLQPQYVDSAQGISAAERAQLIDELIEACLHWANRQPMLLIFEDLHWMDPSTLELLGLLSTRITSAPILLIATLRTESAQAMANLIPGDSLTLQPLADEDAEGLLADNCDTAALQPTQKQRLLQMGQGIPLFLEELAWSASESQASPMSLEQMPPSNLRDLLMARIDNLGLSKPLVQWAAVYGQEANKEVLRRLCGQRDTDFDRHLQALLERGILVYGQTDALQFRHALLQEAAYAALPQPDRKRLHLQVATLCASGTFIHCGPALLARHWSLAGRALEASRAWLAAGQDTALQAAYVETVKLLKNGLAQLTELEESPQKSELEMTLLQTLWGPLTVTAGYWSGELQEVSVRMQALNSAGDAHWDNLFRLHWGNWVVSLFHAHVRASYRITGQLVGIARQSQNPILNAAAQYSKGDTLFWRGEFQASAQEVSAALGLFSEFSKEEQYRQFGLSLDILAHSILAQNLSYSGTLTQAHAVVDTMLEHAALSSDPHEQVVAQLAVCQLAFFRRNADSALRCAEQALQLCQSAGLEHWALILNAYRYWALANRGDDEAAEQLEPLIQAAKAAMPAKAASFTFIHAETCYAIGRYRQAKQLYTQTLTDIRTTGERYRLAETLFRLGDCAMGLGMSRVLAERYRHWARRVVMVQDAQGVLARYRQEQH